MNTTSISAVTEQELESYNANGFCLREAVFSPEEVASMLHAIQEGGRAGRTRVLAGEEDDSRPTALAIWSDLGDDIWAAASTSSRIVEPTRAFVGEEVAFFHGKVMRKEAELGGGSWEWHQDYGYWYDYHQFAYPHLISAFVALDPSTRANGCLQVLKGSHHLGRLNHIGVGDRMAIDPDRLANVEPILEHVYCEMAPGSVLFFHCNLLHGSAPNTSPNPRRSFIVCYNALSNPAFDPAVSSSPVRYVAQPCPVTDNGAFAPFIRTLDGVSSPLT